MMYCKITQKKIRNLKHEFVQQLLQETKLNVRDVQELLKQFSLWLSKS